MITIIGAINYEMLDSIAHAMNRKAWCVTDIIVFAEITHYKHVNALTFMLKGLVRHVYLIGESELLDPFCISLQAEKIFLTPQLFASSKNDITRQYPENQIALCEYLSQCINYSTSKSDSQQHSINDSKISMRATKSDPIDPSIFDNIKFH